MGEQDDTMPRAKRLKLLKEAKERKERLDRGEIIEEPVAAEAPSKSPENDADSHGKDDGNDSAELAEAADASLHIDQPDGGDASLVKAGKDEDESEEEDVLNLAPKRVNWDIERDIAPMLKKLERRTQHAIVEILREKMAAEQQEEDDDDDEEEEDDDDEGDEEEVEE